MCERKQHQPKIGMTYASVGMTYVFIKFFDYYVVFGGCIRLGKAAQKMRETKD